ncbi:hypothetical protein JKP88DRAFT_247911 [Tribonema minus]|uniref:Uncharacterized protein n=1 Tax=Tribonema minus TaxID=303371 RepID=A0A835YRL4_9STRA|nr:hypothetical protein JKP88DRAFT_247911 [Tribonema minus]
MLPSAWTVLPIHAPTPCLTGPRCLHAIGFLLRLSGDNATPATLSMFVLLKPIAAFPLRGVSISSIDCTVQAAKAATTLLRIVDFAPAGNAQQIEVYKGGKVKLRAGPYEMIVCFLAVPPGLVFDSVEVTAA